MLLPSRDEVGVAGRCAFFVFFFFFFVFFCFFLFSARFLREVLASVSRRAGRGVYDVLFLHSCLCMSVDTCIMYTVVQDMYR